MAANSQLHFFIKVDWRRSRVYSRRCKLSMRFVMTIWRRMMRQEAVAVRKTGARETVLFALFTALTAAGAFIRVPVPVCPFTLQFLFTTPPGRGVGGGVCGAGALRRARLHRRGRPWVYLPAHFRLSHRPHCRGVAHRTHSGRGAGPAVCEAAPRGGFRGAPRGVPLRHGLCVCAE